MITLKNDWELVSDGKFHIIRANKNTIISWEEEDFQTVKIVYRSREMNELNQKLIACWKNGEDVEPILKEIYHLQLEIHNKRELC